MKAVHINKKAGSELHSYYDLLFAAKEQEAAGNFEDAIMLYLKCTKIKPSSQLPYDRVMIIHRRQKNLQEEQSFILHGIRVFENFYLQKPYSNNVINNLSKRISRLTGLTDAKGEPVSNHEPVKRWKSRLKTVNRRLSLATLKSKKPNDTRRKPRK
jgi:hypothetical protein